MPISSLVLLGSSKVYKHTKGKTLYISIPSSMAQDSAINIKEGDDVEIEFMKDRNVIEIRPKKPERQSKR